MSDFTVSDYDDNGAITREDTVGEFGQAIVFRYSPKEFVVELNIKYSPFYEERHFKSRDSARKFGLKAVSIENYIKEKTNDRSK